MSQEELANKLGYKSRSSINKIELNARNLTQSRIADIAKALRTTPAYIMGWKEDVFSYENIRPISREKFAVIGEISAGRPRLTMEMEAYVVSGVPLNADFALRVNGDSMTGARILDGDYVFVREQEMVENGEIAVVVIGDEATLKRVFYYPEKAVLVLHPENSKYQDIIYMGDELSSVRILGKVVAFQSDVR